MIVPLAAFFSELKQYQMYRDNLEHYIYISSVNMLWVLKDQSFQFIFLKYSLNISDHAEGREEILTLNLKSKNYSIHRRAYGSDN
jgi:hypothetical protein